MAPFTDDMHGPGRDPHVSNEDIFFFSEGLLETEESRVVSAHLRECETCSRRYLEEVEFSAALRELPMPAPSPGWAATVVKDIRTRREESSWWWIVAFGLLVASTAKWLIAADLSPGVAAGVAMDWSLRTLSGLLSLVADLGDLETWERAAQTARTVIEAAAASPSWSAASLAAAAMVAIAANAFLWSMAKRYLTARG